MKRAFTIASGLTLAAVAVQPSDAFAQTQLPDIVVKGASLEQASAKPKSPADAPAATAVTPKPAAKRTAAPSGGGAASDAAAGAGSVEATGTAGSGASESGSINDPSSAGGIARDKLGTSVTVVTGEDLKRREIRTVAEALRSLPGVQVVRSGSVAGYTEVRIRGGEANGTKVLIDGIEANDPSSGAFDFSGLATEGIDRIEVIRGGQSVIYGSGATGGAINIITKKGYGPATITVRAEGGTFDTRDASVRISGGNDRAWGSALASWRETNGYNIALRGQEADGSTLGTFVANGGFRPFKDVTIDFNVRRSETKGDRDGFGGVVAGQLATAVDDASTFSSEVLLAGVNVRWDMLDGRLTHVIKAGHNQTKTTDTDLSFPAFPFFSKYDSTVDNLAYLSTYRFETPALMRAKHAITGLLDTQEETFAPLGDLGDRLRRDRGRVGAATEYRGEFADRLFVTAGLRHDDNDAFDDYTTWRTTATVKIPEMAVRPHASVGTSYRVPTLFEQFGSLPVFYRPNPNLQPEEVFGWDAGLETTLWNGRIVFDVTYFKDVLTNEIARNAAGPPAPTLINYAGESTREGVEFAVKLRLMDGLSAGASYTYLEALDPAGQTEVRRPRHAARFDLDYEFHQGRGKVHLGAVYHGARQDLGFTLPFFNPVVRVGLEDYWVVSVAASYKVQPGVEMFGRVENLLNETYQELYGYATPGIAAYAGVRLTFEDTRSVSSLK